MTFLDPSYLPIKAFELLPAEYEWSDKNPYSVLGEVNPFTEDMLSKLSYRAVLAYAVGCSEWVVYRLRSFTDDDRPVNFLEACWACEMSTEYSTPEESNEDEWKGVVRGPIDLSLMTILNTMYGIEEGACESDAAFAELLPIHVLPDPKIFLHWRESVLKRLEEYFPRDDQFLIGEPVPREALDPLIDISSYDKRKTYVEKFLGGVNRFENYFVSIIE